MSKFDLAYKDIAKLKLGALPPEIKSDEVVEIIVNSFDKILNELQKSFEFFSTTSNSQVDRVLLTGGGALITDVDGLFSQPNKAQRNGEAGENQHHEKPENLGPRGIGGRLGGSGRCFDISAHNLILR